jgi:hypothetical protein
VTDHFQTETSGFIYDVDREDIFEWLSRLEVRDAPAGIWNTDLA